jgi:EAL domain-containing protein (putative c-di-GMP-specific phosphodiesterase class I)
VALGLTVTKIESSDMRETLGNQSVAFLQGSAISRPAKAVQAAEWFRKPERLPGVN